MASFGLGRKVAMQAQNIGQNYLAPIAREAGRQISPSDVNSIPFEQRPMGYADFLDENQRRIAYPNYKMPEPKQPIPSVPSNWYKGYNTR